MLPQNTTRYPARIIRTCIGCGKTFSVPPSRLKYGPALWCSAPCRYSTPGWHDTVKPTQRRSATCEICGVQFDAVLSKVARFCSRRCVGVANGRRRAAGIKKQRVYTCAECGKTFTDKACLAHRKRFCSRTCLGVSMLRPGRIARPTSIERALRAGLAAVGIDAIPEHVIGPFCIDLAIPDRRLAIEADGTYWHALPASRIRDAKKDAYLRVAGWTLLRFSEARIHADLAGCVRDVQALL